jgi:putative exporter of polyketide antibiotics
MKPEKQQSTITRHIPWWLHLLVAILSYSLLKYILPALASDQAGREIFAEIGGQAAPIIAIIFLLLAANGLYKDAPENKKEKEGEQKEEEKNDR